MQKMVNLNVLKQEMKEYNPNGPQLPDHTYTILIIGGSVSEKTNSLFNLINQQPDIDQTYFYPKDSRESQYIFLINKQESTGLKHFNDSKAFIKYSNDMDEIYNDMIANMVSNKKRNA